MVNFVDNGFSVNVVYNGKLLGQIEGNIDGYYVFWPELGGGYWSEEILTAISKFLIDNNNDWHETVCKELESKL